MADSELNAQAAAARKKADASADAGLLAKGGAIQISGQFCSRLLAFVFIAAVNGFLNQSAYGLYRKVFQVLSIGGQVGLLGFNYSAMRFIARARAKGEPGAVRAAIVVGLWGTLVTGVIAFVILHFATEPIASYFAGRKGDPQEVAHLLEIGAAFVPLFALMQTLRYCTQAYKTMIPSVIVGNIVQPGARFGIGIAVLFFGATVAGLMWVTVASAALGAIAGFYFLLRTMDPAERKARPKWEIGPMINFAIPQAGASMLGIQSLGLGVIIVGLYKPDFVVGAFAIALSLQGPGGIFLSGIVNIWAPVVSDLYERGEIQRLEGLYQVINRWVVTFSFPLYVVIIVEPMFFVHLLNSDSETAGQTARILALGNLFYTGTGPTGYVLSMTGRPWINFINSLCAVGAYMGLGALAVPRYGAQGMAVVDACVTAAVNLVRVAEARLLVGVQPYGKSFLKPLTASAALAAVLLAWKLVPGGMWMRIPGFLLGGLAYLAVLKALGVDESEREVWARIKRRAFKRRGAKQAG